MSKPKNNARQTAPMPQLQKIVLNHYKLGRKLGAGAFAEVYKVIETRTNREYAVKLENANAQHPQLLYEARVYRYLLFGFSSIEKGIPEVQAIATEGQYNIMVMDSLGDSLEHLFNKCNRKFSLKTVLMLAEQILSRIEFIHFRGILHRDIKPDNLLMGKEREKHKVYMIDFGLSKKYLDRNDNHIPCKEGKSLTGTARYASINTHLGYEQGRRDDLESLGYIIMYFLRGSLPWQNLQAADKKEKYEKIKKAKLGTSVEELCKGFPSELVTFLSYSRNLKFEERPDYAYLRTLLLEMFKKSGFEWDYAFDWEALADEEDEQLNDDKIETRETTQKEKKRTKSSGCLGFYRALWNKNK